MSIIEKLRSLGWSDEGAQFIADRAGDRRLGKFFRRLGQPQPYKRPKPVNRKQPIPQRLRWQVWERDNFTCQHCGVRRDLSVDHIIPEIKGGQMTLDNLQTLCMTCNNRKGAR